MRLNYKSLAAELLFNLNLSHNVILKHAFYMSQINYFKVNVYESLKYFKTFITLKKPISLLNPLQPGVAFPYPPKNIRKPEGFLMFSGGVEKQHRLLQANACISRFSFLLFCFPFSNRYTNILVIVSKCCFLY